MSLVLFVLAMAVLAFCLIVGVLELVWKYRLDEPPDAVWARRQDALERATAGVEVSDDGDESVDDGS